MPPAFFVVPVLSIAFPPPPQPHLPHRATRPIRSPIANTQSKEGVNVKKDEPRRAKRRCHTALPLPSFESDTGTLRALYLVVHLLTVQAQFLKAHALKRLAVACARAGARAITMALGSAPYLTRTSAQATMHIRPLRCLVPSTKIMWLSLARVRPTASLTAYASAQRQRISVAIAQSNPPL
ncbi:hypothetical protein FB451DRAFT_1560781 [Mycena latifolia]|nr:hypothetical protein FB451DRAFT_1560781 [Mycena latifolia]